jgi:hypothetical protein
MPTGEGNSQPTSLADVIGSLDVLDQSAIIYAEASPAWQPSSRAMVRSFAENDNVPMEVQGLEYFLEVELATQVLSGWRQFKPVTTPEDEVQILIHYARFDSLPV